MKKYIYDIEKVKESVANNLTYTDVLKDLNIPIRGGNLKTLKKVIENNNIDTSHFNQYKRYSIKCSKSLLEYINSDKKLKSQLILKKLIKEGYKEYKCEVCGISTWQGKDITLQIHHIDGDYKNNTFDNLQIICPNCHSQTPNHAGKSNRKEKEKYFCIDCGKELKTNAKTGRCCTCAAKQRRKIFRPSYDEIQNVLKQFDYNYCAVGRYFNVSDNCIRKWIKIYKSS